MSRRESGVAGIMMKKYCAGTLKPKVNQIIIKLLFFHVFSMAQNRTDSSSRAAGYSYPGFVIIYLPVMLLRLCQLSPSNDTTTNDPLHSLSVCKSAVVEVNGIELR